MPSWRSFLNWLAPRKRHAGADANTPFTDSDFDEDPQPEFERYRVDRQVVLLRPRQPYARWVEQCMRRSRTELSQIPEYKQLPSASQPRTVTLAERRADCTDETHWPTKLTLASFRQWFDIECFDMVLVSCPLARSGCATIFHPPIFPQTAPLERVCVAGG